MPIRLQNFVLLHFVVLALLGTGCTSITITSNKDASAVHKVDRLFILINPNDVEKQPLSKILAIDLQNCLTNTPVQLEVGIVDPLELDPHTQDRRIDAFHPDAVLVIQVKNRVVDEFGNFPTIMYDAILFDTTTKKRLWRASIDNSGDISMMNRRMQAMARSLVAQLKQDGFL